MSFRERIIETARKYEADYVGFGSVSSFEGTNVTKIFDRTKTVICLGFRVLRGSYRGVEEGTTYYQYSTTGVETIEETIMPMALLKVSGVIEDEGYIAVPQKRNQLISDKTEGTNPEVYHNEIYRIDEPQLDFLSCAVLCGIGERGLSGSVLTRENGPFVRFCAVLTDADIEESEILPPYLCDNCGECIKACPGNAIAEDGTLSSWQCAVYYAGANRSKNPFMPPDAYEGIERREEIMRGEIALTEDRAKEVLRNTYFYPPIKHGYVSSICGRACDRACYIHLEKQGKLINAFREGFRKREDWKLE